MTTNAPLFARSLVCTCLLALLSLGPHTFTEFFMLAHAMSTTPDTKDSRAGMASPEEDRFGGLFDLTPVDAQVSVLKNGLTVLTKQDERFPLAAVRLWVRTGSANETEERAGISHFLEHMVFKGSDKRAPGEAAREIESVGGQLNAGTSFDYTVYIVDVPAEKFGLGMDVVHDFVFNAKIGEDDLQSERKVVLSELERGEDNPRSLLFKTMQAKLWPGTPYAWPIIGTRESVSAMTRDDIVDYVERTYQPAEMLLVVAGDVTHEQVLARAEEYFGSLQNTRVTTRPQPIPVEAMVAAEVDAQTSDNAPRVTVIPGAYNKVYVSIGLPAPSQHSPHEPALMLLTHIMGSGSTSRLYRTFKYEESLVDAIGFSTVSLERVGMLYLSATLDADDLQPFLTRLGQELATFDPMSISDEELDRARLNLADSLYSAKETISGVAGKLGYFQFFFGSVDAENDYLNSLRTIDREELARVYRRYMRPDRWRMAIAAPADGVADAEKLQATLTKAWPMTTPANTQAESMVNVQQQTAVGDVEVVTLPGGAQLILQPDTSLPYAALTIDFPGGDALLSSDQQGLGELAASMLTRGTESMDILDWQEFLADRASSIGTNSGRSSFRVSARMPARFAPDVLPLVRQALTKPALADEELVRAKDQQLASIASKEDQPLGLAFRRLFPFLFTSPGYGYLHLGTRESVAGLTAEDVQRFLAAQRAQPFVFSICGTYDDATVREFARELADSLTAPPTSATYGFPAPDFGDDRKLDLTLPGRNQSHVLRLYRVTGLDSEDMPALEVLQSALAGQSGILFTDLRDEQGIGYVVTSFLWQTPGGGFLAFYVGTDPDRVDEARAGLDRAVSAITTTPLTDAQLDRAVNKLIGEYYRDNQGLSARARDAAFWRLRGMDVDTRRHVFETARTLTATQVRDVAARYLTPDNIYRITVQP